ncbi:hypothetical protein FPZ12_030715 [Amycolatopsis acidicola]|uniref:Uncharacterized protein n=1 Tax=Amycolatopsis acidicola TaxID=2596893 RepID=A0A5N0UWD8_9PSEU|nr:hypothetical protein [Amycolatopsis acidicola]KAA9155036.1 hypothetical protein FPZ12_030715 [Amycolatopsis acidicola]
MIHPHIRWNSLLVAVLVGIVVVVVVWWAGPGALGGTEAPQGTVTPATVSVPADCANSGAKETVEFEFGSQNHTGSLDACGHDKGDKVDILVPTGIGSGTADVHLADVNVGDSPLRRPVGLVLLALSCISGAVYAFLVQRGPRRPTVAA